MLSNVVLLISYATFFALVGRAFILLSMTEYFNIKESKEPSPYQMPKKRTYLQFNFAFTDAKPQDRKFTAKENGTYNIYKNNSEEEPIKKGKITLEGGYLWVPPETSIESGYLIDIVLNENDDAKTTWKYRERPPIPEKVPLPITLTLAKLPHRDGKE